MQQTSLRDVLKALASKKAGGMLGFFAVNKRLQALLEKKLDLAQETEELEKVWSDVNQQRINSLQLAYEAMADTWVEYALHKGMPVFQHHNDHEKFMTMRRNGLGWAYDRVRENLGLIPNELGEGPYSVDNLKKGYVDLNKAGYEAVELLNLRLRDAAEDAKLDKTTIANVAPNVPAHDENH